MRCTTMFITCSNILLRVISMRFDTCFRKNVMKSMLSKTCFPGYSYCHYHYDILYFFRFVDYHETDPFRFRKGIPKSETASQKIPKFFFRKLYPILFPIKKYCRLCKSHRRTHCRPATIGDMHINMSYS